MVRGAKLDSRGVLSFTSYERFENPVVACDETHGIDRRELYAPNRGFGPDSFNYITHETSAAIERASTNTTERLVWQAVTNCTSKKPKLRRCQFAPPCRHPICRVMPPEGRVERPSGMMPRIERGVDRLNSAFATLRSGVFSGSCRHSAGRALRLAASGRCRCAQRRRRWRARGFCAGDGGGGSSASSFGLSLGR